jgi:hypothetical protein
VEGLDQICPLPKNLSTDIKAIGSFDDMCPFVPVNRRIPNDREIRAILTVGHRVADFASRHLR